MILLSTLQITHASCFLCKTTPMMPLSLYGFFSSRLHILKVFIFISPLGSFPNNFILLVPGTGTALFNHVLCKPMRYDCSEEEGGCFQENLLKMLWEDLRQGSHLTKRELLARSDKNHKALGRHIEVASWNEEHGTGVGWQWIIHGRQSRRGRPFPKTMLWPNKTLPNRHIV